MGYIQGIASEQTWLLPYSIEELIEPNNPVRVIEAYVDSLSIHGLGFTHVIPAETGRPPYDPKDLLKLYIYGYLNRIRSSRRLMLECHRNVELFYLLNMVKPDFRTIADFRKENRKALKEVFKDFVTLCGELGLLGKKMFTVDGAKIRAVNGKKKAFTVEILDNKLKYLEEQKKKIEQYLADMDKRDEEERIPGMDIKPENMPAHLEEIKKRVEKYKGYKERMEQTGETQILETDPECRSIRTKEGILPAYNIQTVVDDESHMIVAFETTNANTDQGLLDHMAEQTKQELNIEVAEFKADKGYESREDILNCVMHGSVPDVGFKYDKEQRFFDLEYKLQRRSVVSCFIRHEDGRVTCPIGRELFKTHTRKYGIVYTSHEACRTCPNRCTDSQKAKEVQFGEKTIYVPVYMYGESQIPLQQIPDVQQDTPYNHFGRRKQSPAQVRLTIRRDPDLMQKRKEVVEHPFGTIKWYDGAHYFLCKGKEKVSAEIALSYLTYNLRRAMNILGVGVLVARIRERNRKNKG